MVQGKWFLTASRGHSEKKSTAESGVHVSVPSPIWERQHLHNKSSQCYKRQTTVRVRKATKSFRIIIKMRIVMTANTYRALTPCQALF